MIDNYLLTELVTFARERTLARTAAKLNVTQPTVTRGMQKLEEEFGVRLFNRQPNRISLTATGQLAAKLATQLLEDNQALVTTVRNYSQAHQVIKIACTAPGPRIVASQLEEHTNLPVQTHPDLISPDQVETTLASRQFTLIISNREVQSARVESLYLGQEHLFVNLDQFMYLASQQAVTFKELRGISFIVLSDIGPWKAIVQKQIPEAKFLYQTDYTALRELTKYSNFPFFTTNVTIGHQVENYPVADRVTLPITDPAATMTFYASYLKDQRTQLQPVIQALATRWPK